MRALETVTLPTNTETYAVATLTTKGTRCIDIKNITVLWGSQRVPMLWCSWTKFNAWYRTWQVNQSRPCVWAFFGSSSMAQVIYIQPVPDQDYSAEIDFFYIPEDLTNDSDVDELAYPFSSPVAYYAAYKAKLQEQSMGEADGFLKQYAMKGMEASQSFTARIPNPYY